MKIFLLAVVIVGIAIVGLAIQILLKKNGKFSKTCSSSFSPDGKKSNCACSGDGEEDETKCQYYNEHHGDGAN